MIIRAIAAASHIGLFVIAFFAITSSANSAPAACTLTPIRATNNVGGVRSVTAHVVQTNGAAASGVEVSFQIISGPNAPISQVSNTDAGGNTAFAYTSNGSDGQDVIRATGTVNGQAFSCLATQIWVVAGSAPTISCPGNIVTNVSGGGCARSLAFTVMSSGSPMPTTRCRIGNDVVTSPHSFPAGVTTVTCTSSNANGVTTCSFTVTVTETTPPDITCPGDVSAAAVPGSGGTEVHFEAPNATDSCGVPTVACDPSSGSFFAVGTTPVTCTATDASGNTNSCTFNVAVEEVAADTHDLAIVRIRAPRLVTLTAARPVVTKRVVVTIQNRSPHTEAFFDSSQLANLVTLTVQSFDANTCVDISPLLLERPPQRRLPFNLRPRQKLNVYFEVTFDCAVNPARGPGAEDFLYSAQVHHEAIDGAADTHPECDVCPRPPLEGGFDPNPNGRIRDRGCGAPAGGGTFGNDVLTDVVVK